jgi:GPH family glycoside/pentoside/hexuronide:cation symporter
MTEVTASTHQDVATKSEDRVPVLQKIGYGLGTFNDMWGHWLYHSVAFPVFNIYLHVDPLLVGWALFLNRIFDAFSDPFFGWLSDNTRTRFGRRRPFILVGGIIAGMGFPLLFWVSPGWGSTHLNLLLHWDLNFGLFRWAVDLRSLDISNYFWYMISSAALYIPMMSCFNMPFQSLGAEMTPDYNERTSVQAYKGVIQKIAEVGMFSAMAFTSLSWFKDASGKPNTLHGIQVYSIILGCIMALVGIVMFFTVKERYYESVVVKNKEKIGLLESFGQALRCKPFRIQLLMTIAFAMGTSMVGALGYYATVYFVCQGNQDKGNIWNFYMGISALAGGFFGAPFFAKLARQKGKQFAVKIILATAFAVFVGTWFTYNPAIVWLQLLASGPIAFATAGYWMLMGSMGADVMDYDELQTGKRREGAFASCNSWMVKFGLALGSLASGTIIKATGFNDAIGVQSEQTIFMIRFLLAAVPLVGIVFAFILLLRFPLNQQKVAEIRLQLEARRGKV